MQTVEPKQCETLQSDWWLHTDPVSDGTDQDSKYQDQQDQDLQHQDRDTKSQEQDRDSNLQHQDQDSENTASRLEPVDADHSATEHW